MKRLTKAVRLTALAACAPLALSACGGGGIKDTKSAAGKKCDTTVNMAVNPWVGYEASAHVVGQSSPKSSVANPPPTPARRETSVRSTGSFHRGW